jgi:hypothetical protein
MRGTPAEGYLGATIQANLGIVMLATGFETYCGRRFREIPNEGRAARIDALSREFGRRSELGAALESLDDALTTLKLDFGNYETCRRAFNAAYGIRLGELISGDALGDVKRMFEYRHRVVHVSSMVGFLNQPRVPPEEPVFATAALVTRLKGSIDAFIQALHSATLSLPAGGSDPPS